MLNIVIVSHGSLGKSLIEAAEMIAGPMDNLHAVSLLPGEAPESFGEKLTAVMKDLDEKETLILIDLFGGTPYNVAARQVLNKNVECVTGANLPMLLELCVSCDEYGSLSDLAARMTEAGQQSVKNLGPMLQKK
jgi:mannose/fructose/sorbose-specific phosphotransferase system IIA component